MFPNLFSRAPAPGSRAAWVLSVPSRPCSPPPLPLSSTSSPLRLAPSLTADLGEAIKAFGGCAQLGRLRGAKSQFLVFSLLHLSLGPNRFGSFKVFVSPRNLSALIPVLTAAHYGTSLFDKTLFLLNNVPHSIAEQTVALPYLQD